MGHYVKVLTVHLYIRGVKYFLTVLYGQLASFFLKKTEVFLKLTVLLSLRNNHVMTTVITFSESASRIKVILYWTHFSWNVSSYFKLSAWKRSCTISFELQMPQISSTPFWKALRSSTTNSRNCNLPPAHFICTSCCVFQIFFTYLWLHYINVLYHTINICDVIHMCMCTKPRLKLKWFCEINSVFWS